MLEATGVRSKKSSTSAGETAGKPLAVRRGDWFAEANCFLSIFGSVKAAGGGKEKRMEVRVVFFGLKKEPTTGREGWGGA